MAVKLARNPDSLAIPLIRSLQQVQQTMGVCSRCGHLTPQSEDPCSLCTDPLRQQHVVCVVEDPGDIAILERSGSFQGRYHALMGKISPMRGVGVSALRVSALLERIEGEGIREVILALNADVESEATASYLHDQLTGKVKVSRIALGLPAGGGIAYADPVTLERAIRGRHDLERDESRPLEDGRKGEKSAD
jgi:recombination protein RecR